MTQPSAELKAIGFLTKLVEASCSYGLQRRQIGNLLYSSEMTQPTAEPKAIGFLTKLVVD